MQKVNPSFHKLRNAYPIEQVHVFFSNYSLIDNFSAADEIFLPTAALFPSGSAKSMKHM